jgi:hypothetical protein
MDVVFFKPNQTLMKERKGRARCEDFRHREAICICIEKQPILFNKKEKD